MSEERKAILNMVKAGTVTPEQGAALLAALSEPEEAATPPEKQQPPAVPDAEPVRQPGGIRRPWLYPLWAGVIVLLAGGAVVTSMYQQRRVNALTWLCGWIPLFLGLTVVTVAAWSRTAHWIHLRVRDHGKRVYLSLPLPLGLAATALRVARRYVPKLRDTAIDEGILALRDGLRGHEDITIEVQDDEEGESMQILSGGEQ